MIFVYNEKSFGYFRSKYSYVEDDFCWTSNLHHSLLERLYINRSDKIFIDVAIIFNHSISKQNRYAMHDFSFLIRLQIFVYYPIEMYLWIGEIAWKLHCYRRCCSVCGMHGLTMVCIKIYK